LGGSGPWTLSDTTESNARPLVRTCTSEQALKHNVVALYEWMPSLRRCITPRSLRAMRVRIQGMRTSINVGAPPLFDSDSASPKVGKMRRATLIIFVMKQCR